MLPDTAALRPVRSAVVSRAESASSTFFNFSDFFCALTNGTRLPAGNVNLGSSKTTRSCSAMAGEVLKMLAVVMVPSTSALTVAGPPPSLMATNRDSGISSP
ncbi:Uncharacterised protein [Mycobacteroides abscessus subsp. abscessus]|nr:Uncharacterised protein [Mycobacteroides abscessus subsp. abscessus]